MLQYFNDIYTNTRVRVCVCVCAYIIAASEVDDVYDRLGGARDFTRFDRT